MRNYSHWFATSLVQGSDPDIQFQLATPDSEREPQTAELGTASSLIRLATCMGDKVRGCSDVSGMVCPHAIKSFLRDTSRT